MLKTTSFLWSGYVYNIKHGFVEMYELWGAMDYYRHLHRIMAYGHEQAYTEGHLSFDTPRRVMIIIDDDVD